MVKQDVYKALGLNDEEYQKIETILKREPSATELAMFSVEWSEHCGYPRSRKWLSLFPKKGKYETLIGEDAGGIIVDDLAIIFKMESHNHPSQVEPKQGAATGVGGIIRDIFTSGARPIASLDSLRFGSLDEPYSRYLLSGVVEGIAFYGNCIGVPTIGGEIYFDDSYSGNCLVNAMSIGICKREEIARARATGIGNVIMYVGSSTGRDGIGGCSVLASHEFSVGEEKRPTVQIGDPFTEKCLIEATIEALKTGHILGIKDMGAAGLTCSSAEMAAAGGVGVEIDLSKVPLREEGMEPWEIMMSESQERMLCCIKKGKEAEIEKIFKKWDLNASVIGTVINEEKIIVKYNNKVVADAPTRALAEAPLYDMPFRKIQNPKSKIQNKSKIKNPNKYLLKLLDDPNIASKAWVYEQYDHMVQTNTAILPGSDAAVVRIKESSKGIAATTDCNSNYCFLNPYRGAQIAVAEAARNLVCSGADPAAVTDCLNFGNPEKPDRFWQFKECVQGISDACKYFNLPVVSGNVSFYNESPKGAIKPTPTIGMIGILSDMKHRTTISFKNKGDIVVLLGETTEESAKDAPNLDLDLELRVQKTCLDAIRAGLINSAHDCAEGGLAVALSECSISGNIGASINLVSSNLGSASLLFSESQSRIIVTLSPENIFSLDDIAMIYNVPVKILGKVGGKGLSIKSGKKKLIDLKVSALSKTYKQALPKRMGIS